LPISVPNDNGAPPNDISDSSLFVGESYDGVFDLLIWTLGGTLFMSVPNGGGGTVPVASPGDDDDDGTLPFCTYDGTLSVADPDDGGGTLPFCTWDGTLPMTDSVDEGGVLPNWMADGTLPAAAGLNDGARFDIVVSSSSNLNGSSSPL